MQLFFSCATWAPQTQRLWAALNPRSSEPVSEYFYHFYLFSYDLFYFKTRCTCGKPTEGTMLAVQKVEPTLLAKFMTDREAGKASNE